MEKKSLNYARETQESILKGLSSQHEKKTHVNRVYRLEQLIVK